MDDLWGSLFSEMSDALALDLTGNQSPSAHITGNGSDHTEDHQLFVAKIGTKTSTDQLAEGIAPEKGRGNDAQCAKIRLERLLHQGKHQIDVLATVIEEQVHKAKAEQRQPGMLLKTGKILFTVAVGVFVLYKQKPQFVNLRIVRVSLPILPTSFNAILT